MPAEEFICGIISAHIEIDPLSAFEGTLPSWQDSSTQTIGKRSAIFRFSYHHGGGFSFLAARNISSLGTSPFGNCMKNYHGEGEHVVTPRAPKVGPSGHPPGPLGLCNPNEKQKPPPLCAGSPCTGKGRQSIGFVTKAITYKFLKSPSDATDL